MRGPAGCFVTVEWWEEPPPDPVPTPSVCLWTGPAAGGGILLARTGLAGTHRAAVLDEHLTVDADVCSDAQGLDCADVLRGSRPRPRAEAVRWLAEIGPAGSGCRLAAVPLTGGGWAARGGTDPGVVALPCRVPPEQWLFVSCLHAWLVAGLPLSGMLEARPRITYRPAIP
ncbi:hypothetical protein [Streptomyces sp. GMR22]|uniref:hypothetical protein n=1 Tax=Streptomyces sp. GMR22 TaxID=2759524 RepID=UPI0015F86846|nr:hypothetical protein [Streptomyces sp. GMR22]MBA6439130.1 hypothetical protein [Streptomyces sp. GMR22]